MSAHVTLQARVEQYLAERRHAGFELSTMGHGLVRFAVSGWPSHLAAIGNS